MLPLSLFALATFPLQLIVIYLVACFNDGPQWSKLATKFSIAEGMYDASLQFVLQLFVVFTREDRYPSYVQLASMTTSIVFLAWSRIDAWMMDQEEETKNMSVGDWLTKYLTFMPLSLTNSSFKLCSIGFIPCNLEIPRSSVLWDNLSPLDGKTPPFLLC